MMKLNRETPLKLSEKSNLILIKIEINKMLLFSSIWVTIYNSITVATA